MKRLLSLSYGVICCTLAAVTAVYLAGFLLGMGVPKAINDGDSAPPAEVLLIDLALVTLFGAAHWLMARPDVQAWSRRVMPRIVARGTYALVSSALLALLLWGWQPLPAVVWDVRGTLLAPLFWLVFALGLSVFASAAVSPLFDHIGLWAVYLRMRQHDSRAAILAAQALYAVIRQPLRFGLIAALWSTPHLTLGHLIFAAGVTACLLLGIQTEEGTVMREHPTAYARYRRRANTRSAQTADRKRTTAELPAL